MDSKNKYKYKITVVIPTFNTGKFLNDSVGSIINQSIGFDDVEVIMVDDKSTDSETIDLINDYTSKYSNCRAIFLDKNSGFPGLPRNVGIDNALGEYVMVMDHDDSYSPDFLETLYNKIVENDVDMVISNYLNVYEDATEKSLTAFDDTVSEVRVDSIEENLRLFRVAPSIWTRLFRKSFLKENNIRFIEGMLAEDLHFYMHSLLLANGILYLNDYFGYNYRIRNSEKDKSTIHIRNKKYLSAMVSGYYKTWDLLKSFDKDEYLFDLFDDHIRFWFECLNSDNISKEDKKELVDDFTPLLRRHAEFLFNEHFISFLDAGNYSFFIKHYDHFTKDISKKYSSNLFVNSANGFSSEDCVSLFVDEGNNKISFDLSEFDNIVNLRFDPIECKFVNCNILSINSDCDDVKIVASNSFKDYKESESQDFITHDPQYFLEGDFSNCSYIEFEFDLKFLSDFTVSNLLHSLLAEKDKIISNQKNLIQEFRDNSDLESNFNFINSNTSKVKKFLRL